MGRQAQLADVLVVGSLNVDLVCTLRRRPAPGETVRGERLEHHPGGKGANQASAAVRAGARTVLVGAVGDDQYGRAYLDALAVHGVDIAGIAVLDQVGSGLALIDVTPDGENSIVIIPGANGQLGPEHLPAPAAAKPSGVVLCQLEVPFDTVMAAATLAAAARTRYVLNPSPIQDLPSELLQACDPLVVNLHEASQLLSAQGESAAEAGGAGLHMARRLLDLGPRSAVVTLGADGAVWIDRDELAAGLHVPAPAVDVVDTTGAGDAFTGTLAAALALGRTPERALRAAVEAGSAASGWQGAQPWRFDASASTAGGVSDQRRSTNGATR